MTPRNEDFLFAQEAQRRGYLTEEQLEEGFDLQKRMMEELKIDERLAVILVKRGWLAEEQARRVYARITPDTETDEIQGYRILEKIGRGAMGTVYKAMHTGLQRPVAIKILRRDLARDATQVERLKEEAKLLASLDHPNIVRALDAGESGGFPFVVMEYVEGETLKERIAERGPLHEIDALRIARGLADALERARRMGVVHRDVKPGNVILAKRKDEPKLMDLGLAKGPVDLGLTQHGATVGTPQYISPEQAQDPRRADTRSDIYSLGATLYAAVTGRPPFQGTTLAEVLTKVLYEAPPPPRVLNKKVSPEVGYLIERMMLKDPALRYRTPAAVVHDIDEVLAGRSIIPEGFTGNWEAYLLRQRIRKWTKIGVTAALVLVLLVAGVVWGINHARMMEARETGGRAIEQVLLDTAVTSADDALVIRRKLVQARGVYERWEDVEPENLGKLRAHVHVLERQDAQYSQWGEVENKVEEQVEAGRYDLAVSEIEGFTARIPGTDDPAEVAAHDRRGKVIQISEGIADAERSKARRQPSSSLDEFLAQQRAYRKRLDQGLYESERVEAAKTELDQAIGALERMQGLLQGLEDGFSEEGLETLLGDLGFREVIRRFEADRGNVLEECEGFWQKIQDGGWIRWSAVCPHVEERLDTVEETVDALMVKRGEEVVSEAGDLHREGRSEEAIRRLTRLGNAAREANVQGVRADALAERDRIRTEYQALAKDAEAALDALEDDVLVLLRQGNPEGIHKRVAAALENRNPRWPMRAETEALGDLARAYETLRSRALDTLVARGKVSPVKLRNGETDFRWIVKSTDLRAWTVTVTTRTGGPARVRRIDEVHPDTMLAWAAGDGTPEAILRAVAGLAALPPVDVEPDDLRPLRDRLKAVVDAFEQAGYRGGLARAIAKRHVDTETAQRRREETARALWDETDIWYRARRFNLALWALEQLENYEFTDFYEKYGRQVLAYLERVEKEIANKKLAKRFPGAEIGLDGETTWIEFDWEHYSQLDAFRVGDARATGRIETFHDDKRPVTEGTTASTSNRRLTLLAGIRELVRDRPLALPCIFDPAERIVVEFKLHTLRSPFFLAIDIDGLQVGILSASPTSRAYDGRWAFGADVPLLHEDEKPPKKNFYGRGRGVAFHAGTGLGDPGDPKIWKWPARGRGRFWPGWWRSRRTGSDLFAFEPGAIQHVKVVRDRGRITLYVDDNEIASKEQTDWENIGRESDRNRYMRNKGTGLIQILTYTPQGIDDLRLEGLVLDRYRGD